MNPFSPKARAFRQKFFLAIFLPHLYFAIRFGAMGHLYGYFAGSQQNQETAMKVVFSLLFLFVMWLLPDVMSYAVHCAKNQRDKLFPPHDTEAAERYIGQQVGPGKPLLIGLALTGGVEITSWILKFLLSR